MKKTLLIMVMALAVLLTQCRKPEVKFPSPVAPEGTTVSMTVTAGPGSKTDITTAGAITWSAKDKIYVGYDGKYVGCLEIQSGMGNATGTFSGEVTLPTGTENGEKTFHFFYLGSDNSVAPTYGAESVDVDFSSQEIYAEDGKLKNASKHHVGYGSAKGIVAGSEVTGINVTLVSKVALAHFSFKKNSTAYDGALTLSGDKIYSSMTVGFNGEFNGKTKGAISLTGSHSERYVMLVPTGATEAQSLTFTGSSESGTGDVPGLQANKFYGKTEPIAVTLTATTIHVTSVSLNKTSLSLAAGVTETLTATVFPDNATNKSVTWSSSAESVATVADGTVTAVAAGTATITVTTVDGGKTATCAVTVTAPTPASVFTVDKDKGTKVTFAPGNLYYNGANDSNKMNENLPSGWNFYEHQYDCYASGTLSVTNKMEISLFTWGYGTWSTVYNTTTCQTGSDVEMTDWGSVAIGSDPAGTWRTLTDDEWKNLLGLYGGKSPRDKATSLRAWVTLKITETVSVPGLVILPDGSTVTASSVTTTADLASSGAVFLPAAGNRNATFVYSVGSYGDYWSSTPDGSGNAGYIYFYSGLVYASYYFRYMGYSVRLVR